MFQYFFSHQNVEVFEVISKISFKSDIIMGGGAHEVIMGPWCCLIYNCYCFYFYCICAFKKYTGMIPNYNFCHFQY